MTGGGDSSGGLAPRKWWLASLLALLVPGLGHLYVGRALIGAVVSVTRWGTFAVVMTIATLFDLDLVWAMAFGLAAYAGIWLAQIVWAGRLAAVAPADFQAIWCNRLGIYIGFWLTATMLSAVAAMTIRVGVVEAFRIPAGSMRPTMLPGDQIFVAKIGAGTSRYDIGDLIVFTHPQSGQDYIKRIVAKGGDRVSVRAGRVMVNETLFGHAPCDEPLVRYSDTDALGRTHQESAACSTEMTPGGARYRIYEATDAALKIPDFGPATVPTDHVFVLGDNRDLSYDSRAWGPVPNEAIIGKPRIVWWSWDPVGSLRTDRIGAHL